MSDFAGIWRLDGRPVQEADLRRLANGLDGRGLAPPRLWRSGAFGMVHRQACFATRDRSERLPATLPSGAVLAADLRLGARPELIAALGLDAGARDMPDGALLARALDAFDLDAVLARLCGEYAFALWRPATQKLVLARDPLGRRSLFFHRSPDLVAFATRLRPLLALPEATADLDELAAANFMILNQGSLERTLYRAIDRVPSGQYAALTPQSARLQAHWRPPEPGENTIARKDLIDAAREILDRVVGEALDCEGPPTVLLTGGLDTGNILATAARLTAPNSLLTLTRDPECAPAETTAHFFSEVERARAVAALHRNVEWHAVPDDGGDWGEKDVRRAFLEFGAPSRASFNVAWFFPLFRFMAARGSHVSIGGEWGNSFFSERGLALLPQLLGQGRLFSLFRQLSGLKRRGYTINTLIGETLFPYAPLALMRRRLGVSASAPWEGFSAIHRQFAEEIRLMETIDLGQWRSRLSIPPRSAQASRKIMLEDEVAQDANNARRARSGVEHRLPLADRRIVEFFGGLPLEFHLEQGETRAVARRLLRGAAPPLVVEALKTGLQNGDWYPRLSAERPAMLAEMERLRASPSARRMVDLDTLQKLLEDWPADAAAAEKRRAAYLSKLMRGLEMARFLHWRERGN